MATYILSILRTQPMIVFSWDFYQAIALENGLQFRVNGYKFQGRVRVLYNGGADLFDVLLLDRDGNVVRRENEVYLDCLVDVIDRLVEKTDDYAARVSNQYGL